MIDWIRPLTVIVCTAIMIYTNLFGGGGSGFTEGKTDPGVYYLYPTPFSPAPFTFAIWFPLFVGCCLLAVYQALPEQIGNRSLDAFSLPYCCALLANASTPFLRIGWSSIVVSTLFICLCLAVSIVTKTGVGSFGETWFIRIPLIAFATWSGLATVLNLCQWLVSRGLSISPGVTIGIVCLSMFTGILAMYGTKQPVIAFVMLWAGFGIISAQPAWNGISTAVVITSLVTLVTACWIATNSGYLTPRS